MQHYRGRIAPSPTGLLHLGHARTFWVAFARARAAGGTLILRDEDLDSPRCRPELVQAYMEDLAWFGLAWDEGPYHQSQRRPLYEEAFQRLRKSGAVYACSCTRKELQSVASAPQGSDDEAIYPGTCRSRSGQAERSWRFRVPDGESVQFLDNCAGPQAFVAGRDFGDFVIWRVDGTPSYQLAVVVDDADMQISEVVRGEDLLVSTARQILLYRALELPVPQFFHCPLVRDERGVRLSKRYDSLSLRTLRETGKTPSELRKDLGLPAAGW